jgi:hypothetical protein
MSDNMSNNMSNMPGDDERQATCERTSRSMKRGSHNQCQDIIQEFGRIEDESAGTMQDLEMQLEKMQRLQSLAPPEDTLPSINAPVTASAAAPVAASTETASSDFSNPTDAPVSASAVAYAVPASAPKPLKVKPSFMTHDPNCGQFLNDTAHFH